MVDDRTRRTFLRGVCVAGAAGIGSLGPTSSAVGARQSTGTLAGTATDLEGAPVSGATVEARRGGSTVLDAARTDSDGRFSLEVEGPAWIRAAHPARSSGMRAVDPTDDATVRLPPAEATTLRFGGDAMFARRFYEDDDDPLRPRFRIDPDDRRADHRRILRWTAPLLASADAASLNLETPLTTTDWRHPEKDYAFASHPVAADALGEAGVDYVALGNNHAMDALEPGLEETIDALDEADIAHSGAGFSSDEAWKPAIVDRGDATIAFVSCTTVVGERFEVDWSADRNASSRRRIVQGGATLTVDGSVGVAEASEDRLRTTVGRASEDADAVVVQIHGGREYRSEPTDEIRALTRAAAAAGADLVVNHHPHVLGGLEFVDGALVVWSLGNFVFDQVFWETLRSYVLTVSVTDDGVRLVRIDPLLLEGYVPKGVTGQPNRSIRRETAGRSDVRFALGDAGLEFARNGTPDPRVETTVSASAGIYAGREGWVASVDGDGEDARLGRNRLLTGAFGDHVVDDERYEGALWRFGRDGDSSGPDVGDPSETADVDDSGGVRLERTADDVDRALLSPRYRLPIDGRSFTFAGSYRFDGDDGALEVRFSWYDGRTGSSFDARTGAPATTGGDRWRLRWELDAPADATHVDVFVRLEPPDEGVHEAAFDELRLIEWADGATGGREYDHLEIDGTVAVTFASRADDGAIEWVGLDGEPIAYPVGTG